MNFSEKLIRLRKREGISQEELASYLEVSRQAVSRWEQGAWNKETAIVKETPAAVETAAGSFGYFASETGRKSCAVLK